VFEGVHGHHERECSDTESRRPVHRSQSKISLMLRRTIAATAIGYVVLGLATLGLERAGVYNCVCEPECWCKRRGLSILRWVLPYWHREAETPLR
jgi:hypothetical protein